MNSCWNHRRKNGRKGEGENPPTLPPSQMFRWSKKATEDEEGKKGESKILLTNLKNSLTNT